MEFHPIANIFPLMEGEEFKALVNDIKLNGLLEPIWLYQNHIIDGRNRYRACLEAGVEPEYQEWSGEGSLIAFVISKNLKRRHLTTTQLSFVSLAAEPFYAAEAKERQQAAGGDRKSEIYQESVNQKIGEPIPIDYHTTQAAAQVAKDFGTNRQYVADAKKLNNTAPLVAEQAKAGRIDMPAAKVLSTLPEDYLAPYLEKIKQGEKFTETEAKRAIQDYKHIVVSDKLNAISTLETKAAEGVYDVIVIDPPWPMQKIERDIAPNQVGFDYPTMTLEAIRDLTIPTAEDCHVWLWTTHKFLPDAFNILNSWGLTYICTFVWHKPGGFQPFSLPQYNCEFALYAHKGNPTFIDTKDFKLCFDAAREGHSVKPEEFYSMVRRVTAGRRLDMFNRRYIEGFDTWGKESV